MEPVLVTKDRIQYVEDLEITFPREVFEVVRSRGTTAVEMMVEGQEQAFIADKSLVSFVAGVNGQNRKDVLNSTLLAQLAANKKYAIETNMQEWFDCFVDVLKSIGWQLESFHTDTFKARKDLAEVENVVVDILMSAFGASYISIIKNTLSSIKKMGEAGNGKITAFEKNTHSHSKGCFQIGLAVEEKDAVSMQLGTFMLTSSNQIKKILFVKISKDATELKYASSKVTLNKEKYDEVREVINKKLGQSMQQYVTEIEL